MKPLMLSAILDGIATFIFGAAYWMSPLPKKLVPSVSDDAAIQQALWEQIDSSGTYVVPNVNQDHKAFMEKHKAVPNLVVHFNAKGMGPESMGPMMARGLADNILTALIQAFLMRLVVGSLPACLVLRPGRVAGLPAGRSGQHEPMVCQSVFHFSDRNLSRLSFVVVGSVIACFIRPATMGDPSPALA